MVSIPILPDLKTGSWSSGRGSCEDILNWGKTKTDISDQWATLQPYSSGFIDCRLSFPYGTLRQEGQGHVKPQAHAMIIVNRICILNCIPSSFSNWPSGEFCLMYERNVSGLCVKVPAIWLLNTIVFWKVLKKMNRKSPASWQIILGQHIMPSFPRCLNSGCYFGHFCLRRLISIPSIIKIFCFVLP